MESKTKMIAALSNNLDDDQEGKDFERRIRLAEVMLKEKDIDSNKEIAMIQNSARQAEKSSNDDYLSKASEMMQ
jgi:hypothetical protein